VLNHLFNLIDYLLSFAFNASGSNGVLIAAMRSHAPFVLSMTASFFSFSFCSQCYFSGVGPNTRNYSPHFQEFLNSCVD
jgi:hypothetical protein